MTSEAPGKRPFYKYASADATLAVLTNRTVQYSSPLKFNDPFDFQHGLHFDFDIGALHQKVLDRIAELAAMRSVPQVNQDDPWGQIVLTAHKHYRTHGYDIEAWRGMTANLFKSLLCQIQITQSEYQAHWRHKLLPTVKVFCVSEERDNLLMWAHYAKDHTGAVFELWSLPEDDNALSVARRVEYQNAPPVFFTEREWIDNLTGMGRLDAKNLYRRYAYIKSVHWSYEREWRVWYPYSDSPEPYDYVPLRESEFAALYFGCRADLNFIRKASELVRLSFPNCRTFKAEKKNHEYALEYTEI